MSKNFALIGAAGYIAPRHMKAIKQTGGNLLAAMDKFDSIGILDSYFPEASFFTEFERFERHVNKLHDRSQKIDYTSICSPNYLHDSHIRFALRNDSHAICEKPLVSNPWTLEALELAEKNLGKNIYTVLQLRLHPAIIALKKKVEDGPDDKIYDVDLTYLTSRGSWYHASWKGDIKKSGGIATNIGVHFFDMLSWVFGDVKKNDVHLSQSDRAAGYLEYDKARVRWFLSINADLLPEVAVKENKRTYRSIKVDNNEIEFSDGFADLHIATYQDILSGGGYRVSDTRKAIETVFFVRHAAPKGLSGDYHPFCKDGLNKPFMGFSEDLVREYLSNIEYSEK